MLYVTYILKCTMDVLYYNMLLRKRNVGMSQCLYDTMTVYYIDISILLISY